METAYDMAAALARYLFIMIMLYVIIASAVLSIKEARIMRAARKRARLSVRYIEMLAPDDVRGKRFYLNGDCTMGSGNNDDIAIPSSDLKKKHARFFEYKGDMCVSVKQRRFFEVNGERPLSKTVPLCDGAKVWIRDVCCICHGHREEEAKNGLL